MNILDFLKGARDFASQAKQLRADIEKKKQRRDELRSQWLCKADMLELVNSWIDGRKDVYSVNLLAGIRHLQHNPQGVEKTLDANGGRILTATRHGFAVAATVQSMELALLALLGDQIKVALAAEINRMKWPDAGAPMKERLREIAALDAEIAKLEAAAADVDLKINEAQQALNQ